MALPIGAGEIFSVAKFAFQLWEKCKAAEGEFEQVGKEVLAMRTEIELVHLECQDPSSIINVADNKEKTIHRELGVHIRNCKHALSEVEDSLKRYLNMSWWERAQWALKGHAEVADLKSNLSVLATRLNSYVNALTLKGVGIIYANLVEGIVRIEKALEKNKWDARASVNEIMQEKRQSGLSPDQLGKYRDIIDDYAREVCNAENLAGTPRAQTPDSSRGRDTDSSRLGVPTAHRAKSANMSPSGRQAESKKKPFNERRGGEKSKQTLECWLIQIKSANALSISFHPKEKQIQTKEKQMRGQWKLEEMAKQFRSCSQVSKMADDHDLVRWVLEDRKKEEKNSDFTWCPHAAKIERLYLGLGVEEQAMVIVERKLTPEAQKKADEKKLAAKKKAAAKKDPANESKAQSKEKKATAKKNPANEAKDSKVNKATATEDPATKSKDLSKEKKAAARKDPANEAKNSKAKKTTAKKDPANGLKNQSKEKQASAKKDLANESKDQSKEQKAAAKNDSANKAKDPKEKEEAAKKDPANESKDKSKKKQAAAKKDFANEAKDLKEKEEAAKKDSVKKDPANESKDQSKKKQAAAKKDPVHRSKDQSNEKIETAKKTPANESKDQPKEKQAATKKDSMNRSKDQSNDKIETAKKTHANESKDQAKEKQAAAKKDTANRPKEKKGEEKSPSAAAKNGANKTSPRAPIDQTESKQSPPQKDEAKPKKTDKPPVEKTFASKKPNQAIEKPAATTADSTP